MNRKEEQPEVFRYLDHREYLKALYQFRKDEYQRYTYYKFSEDLGFGNNSYSHQVISGIRKLTLSAAQKMARSIPLRKARRKYFLKMVERDMAPYGEKRDNFYAEMIAIRASELTSDLDKNLSAYFSEWYHPIVQELVTFEDFDPDPTWISRHMSPSITSEQAAASLDLLQRLGFIEFDPKKKKWRQLQNKITLPDNISSFAMIRYHQEMIGKAREAVLGVSAEEREMSAMTLAVTEEEFEKIRQKIRDFRREIVSEYQLPASPDKVVQLNFQLFPMSRKPRTDP